ncbi:ATP-dependent helicase [Bacillus sp. 166amftsu]|uniref:UvrD-helicase domain-containing protein n=1 Tax=Bacillus sp. 166amftsu TaxID=1761753 RepID=UPI000899F1F2|nr:ATP-dependent helicase [Bacillus sp. 166amftsu]SDZ00086.1 Superfamily I DNA or RNA helicase [Bacillus sp. 166amftsu]
MKYLNPSDWKPSGDIILEENALISVKSNKNLLIIAGPGAGKTELLAQKASYLLGTNSCKNPKKILAISFKRDAAENLAERVEKRCGTELSKRFVSKTYDSFAKNLLDNFIHGLPNEYKPMAHYMIAIQNRKQNDIRKAFDLAGALPISELSNKDYNDLLNNRLIEQRLPIEEDNRNGKIVKKAWDILLKGKVNELPPTLSFQMISRLAEYLIRVNPLIKMALRQTYSHVFLDEFQDTTDIQYDLLKACFYKSSSTITAVGDNKQRIMLWARAKKDVFEAFKRDFSAGEQRLLMNHRSAPRLVEIQKLVYGYLNDIKHDIKTSEKWSESDGISEIWTFNNAQREAEVAAEKLKEFINNEEINPRDICILVKQLPDIYGEIIINSLKEYGIIARNEVVYQDFLKEEIVKILLNVLISAIEKEDTESWVSYFSFSKLIRGYDSNTDFEKINSLIREIKDFLNKIDNQLKGLKSEKELEQVIWGIINYYDINSIKGLYPKYKQGTFLDELIIDLIGFLWKEYILTNNWLTSIENVRGLNSIPIMTIHKSKGLEYDTVIFIGLEDSAFWNYLKQKEEDTCAFFVALSRAKRRIIFTFSRDREVTSPYYTSQKRDKIKPFYEILKKSQVVEEINY